MRCTLSGKFIIKNYRDQCNKCALEKNRKPRKHKIVDLFEQIDSQDKAYIFGFIWADGCLQDRVPTASSLQLCIHKQDELIIDSIINVIGGSKCDRSYTDKNGKRILRITWQLNSNELCNNFKKLEFRKSTQHVPKQYFSHFVRGLVDGDGCFAIRNKDGQYKLDSIFITSGYDQDWSFLSNVPFKNYVRQIKKKNGNISLYHINGCDKIKFLQWIYDDANLYLERKYKKIHSFINGRDQ